MSGESVSVLDADDHDGSGAAATPADARLLVAERQRAVASGGLRG